MHLAAAEHVEMEMVDGLAAFSAGADDHAESFGEPVLAGNFGTAFGGPSVEMPQQEMSKRRSLYFFHSAIERNKFLMTFDEADPLDCYRHRESIIPQQALVLANSKFAVNMAEKIALRLEIAPRRWHKEFAGEAFTWILGRTPSAKKRSPRVNSRKRWVN